MESYSQKRIGKYDIFRTLGKGGSCKVKLGRDTSTNEPVAVKIMSDELDAEDLEMVMNEVAAINSINHQNVIKIIEHGKGTYEKPSGSREVDYIIVQIASGGELFDFICDTGEFSEPLARYYFRQFMEGLHAVHSQGLCHRDLKPENIFLDSEFVLKIADFGFAAPVNGKNGDGFLRTRLGTKNHMAPEIHLKKPYKGELVDLFASAIILFTMLAGHPPFNEAKPSDPYYKCIGGGKYETFWNAHARNKPDGFYSDDFRQLLSTMLALDPSKRYTLDQIMQHPWYTNPNVYTPDQVMGEFAQRQKVLQQNLEAERAEKEAMKSQAHNKMFVRSGGGESAPEISLGEPKKMLAPYFKAFQQTTQFKTTAHPDLIEDALISELKKKGIEAKIDASKYKIKFEMPWSDGGAKPVNIGIRVSILKDMENAGVYYVEFTNTQGSSFFFQEIYKQLTHEKGVALNFAYEFAA